MGANYWLKLISYAGELNWMDIIVVFPAKYMELWLVNKGVELCLYLGWILGH
jgi:hypothetical protein